MFLYCPFLFCVCPSRTGRCPPSNLSGAPRRRMPAVRPSMRKPRGREAVLMPALCADIRSSAGSPVGGQTKCEGGQQTRLRRSAGMLACSMISTPHRHSRGRHQCHARSAGSRPGAFLQLDRCDTEDQKFHLARWFGAEGSGLCLWKSSNNRGGARRTAQGRFQIDCVS